MLFRFTLNNTIEGSHVVSDPDGWKEIKLKLERHKEFHSLVEVVELPLIFYRSSDLVDGGYEYIRNVELTQGVDAIIEILVEVSEDQGDTYETFFEGLLELETIKDISDASFYKMECNIVRNDFWSKFINRRSQPVDLGGITSLDGDALTLISEETTYLPSQKITQSFERNVHFNDNNEGLFPVGSGSGTTNYLIFDNSHNNLDEIKTRFEYGTQLSTSLPTDVSKYLFKVDFAGTYRIEANIRATYIFGASRNYDISWWFVYRNNGTLSTPFQIGTSQTGTGSSVEGSSSIIMDRTINLSTGGEIYIYGILVLNTSTTISYLSDYDSDPGAGFTPVYTSFEVTGETVYPSTVTDSYMLADAAESILSKIISRNNILSSTYLTSGCAANFAIMKGLHIRGYSMADKPMFMSFDDWWAGANPIFNLGLGYETSFGIEKIRIEDKSYFYNDTPIMTLTNIEKLVRAHDKDRIFKSIEIGYEKWSAESASGIDDPQTKHTYNTRFKIIGKDEKLLSKFFAASLGIEQTRRNRIEAGKDWRLDEDIIIIALNSNSSPFVPEFNEEFSVINLLNSDSRYNIRLTPARNFERWKPFFNGCLQIYIPETYNFGSGEGNFDMSSTGIGSCDDGALAENQNISVTTDFYTTNQYYEFEYPLSFDDYKTLRDNPKNCIDISRTSASVGRKFFIDELEYDHFNARGKFSGWSKE